MGFLKLTTGRVRLWRWSAGLQARWRRKAQVCHGRGHFSTGRKTGWIAAIFLGSSVALAGCASEEAAFRLAPIGEHDVHVGEPWTHSLVIVGQAQAPLRWQLLQGPIGAQVIVDAQGPRLYWLPDVLRLGLRRPGQPRKPGMPLALQVSLTDATGATASASGELLVVPTPSP